MGKIKKDTILKIKWSSDDNSNYFNFGDDLVPYLIKKLSGCEIEHIRYANTRYNIIKLFVKKILQRKFKSTDTKDFLRSFTVSYYIISIGSILQWHSSSRCIVWGSGIISKDAKIKKSKFLAVRGEYTKKRLDELGYFSPNVLGDPALLLPLIYNPKVDKKYKLGIIPHIIHYDSLKNIEIPEDVLIINLNNNDSESVIMDILSCQYTISTSLHGIIVSHAYNIKSLWYEIKDSKLSGDNIKFYDYFSSVGIQDYSPNTLDPENLNLEHIMDQFLHSQSIDSINIDLSNLQRNLISVAPFEVKNEFKI